MRKNIIFIICICLLLISTIIKAEPCVGILKFHSNKEKQRERDFVFSRMYTYAKKNKLFHIPSKKKLAAVQYPYSNTNVITKNNLDKYIEIAQSLSCNYLLVGNIEIKKEAAIQVYLFSAKDKKFVYTIIETISNPVDAIEKISSIMERTSLFIKQSLPVIGSFRASQGALDTILLSWDTSVSRKTFSIYRSYNKYGPYIKIGETKTNNFTDIQAEPGIKYWYKITTLADKIKVDSPVCFGYREPLIPKGLTMDEILQGRNKPRPKPINSDEEIKENVHLGLVQRFYENYFMMSFIFLVGRIYINNGELVVFKDFDYYIIDRDNQILYLIKSKQLYIKLQSKRFFRFVRYNDLLKIPEKDIIERLIKNGIAFSIRNGVQQIKSNDGITRYVPCYEAVGLATEYFKNYKKWKSNTIIFGTSDKDLEKRIKEAQKKGY